MFLEKDEKLQIASRYFSKPEESYRELETQGSTVGKWGRYLNNYKGHKNIILLK